jgi:hypothetical protein
LLLEAPGLQSSGFFPVVRCLIHAWQFITERPELYLLMSGSVGPNDEFRALNARVQQVRLSRWLLETSDGVIQALKVLYYERWTPLQYVTWYGLSEEMGAFFIQRCYQTLDRHRLVKRFEFPDDPDGNGPWKPWRACFE